MVWGNQAIWYKALSTLLILKTVSLKPQHGWANCKAYPADLDEVLQVQQGSLYPALHRLEQQGWIRAKWQRATVAGKPSSIRLPPPAELSWEREKESWSRLSSAINLVVEGA